MISYEQVDSMSNHTSPFTLGALDLSPVYPEMNPADAIAMTLEIPPLLEDMGYSRYWLAEHHGDKVAHSCPELLVPVIAERTRKMRVGTAGILLRLHSPLRVAKDFKLLHAVYPGRIDLGIARGTTSPEVTTLLRDGAQNEVNFESKVAELIGYLRENTEIAANPGGVSPPQIWMLGRNITSMNLAIQHGTAFCFAAFLVEPTVDLADSLNVYRTGFIPSAEFPQPVCSIAVAGVCAATDEKASEINQAENPISVYATVVGSPGTCGKAIRTLHEKTGVTEFIFLDLCRRMEDKVESYRLLAEELLQNR